MWSLLGFIFGKFSNSELCDRTTSKIGDASIFSGTRIRGKEYGTKKDLELRPEIAFFIFMERVLFKRLDERMTE